MKHVEHRVAARCRDAQIAIRIGVPHGLESPMRRRVSAGGDEIIEDSESSRGRHAPRQHIFTAHAILELRLSLEDEHAVARSRQLIRQRRAGESTTDDYCVVAHFHSLPARPLIAAA